MKFYKREKTEKEKAIPKEQIRVVDLNIEKRCAGEWWKCWQCKVLFEPNDTVFVTRYAESKTVDDIYCPRLRGIFSKPCEGLLSHAPAKYWEENLIFNHQS